MSTHPDHAGKGTISERSKARAESFRSLFEGTVGNGQGDAYRGLPIFAAPGVHEAAARLLQHYLPPQPGRRVLELGAGSGALSLRLADAGYRVTASDLFAERFVPKAEADFQPLDLNQHFSAQLGWQPDAIVALELIEHLENPHHFLRECARLLPPGGLLLLSTPNVLNPLSLAMAALDGFAQWFRPEDWQAQGHISPVSPSLLNLACRENGFALEHQAGVADPWRLMKKKRHLRLWLLSGLIRHIARTPPWLRGEVYLAVMRKP